MPENVPENVTENVTDNLADPMVCPKMCPIFLTQFANIVPENVGSNGEPRNRHFTSYFSHFGQMAETQNVVPEKKNPRK